MLGPERRSKRSAGHARHAGAHALSGTKHFFFSFSLFFSSVFFASSSFRLHLIPSRLPQYKLAGISGATAATFVSISYHTVASIFFPQPNPKHAPPPMLQPATQKLQPTTTKVSTRRCRCAAAEQRPRPAMEQATTWSCDRANGMLQPATKFSRTGREICWN